MKFLQTPILLFKPEKTNPGIFMATNILQPNVQNYCVLVSGWANHGPWAKFTLWHRSLTLEIGHVFNMTCFKICHSYRWYFLKYYFSCISLILKKLTLWNKKEYNIIKNKCTSIQVNLLPKITCQFAKSIKNIALVGTIYLTSHKHFKGTSSNS